MIFLDLHLSWRSSSPPNFSKNGVGWELVWDNLRSEKESSFQIYFNIWSFRVRSLTGDPEVCRIFTSHAVWQVQDSWTPQSFIRHSSGILQAFIRHSSGIHQAFIRHTSQNNTVDINFDIKFYITDDTTFDNTFHNTIQHYNWQHIGHHNFTNFPHKIKVSSPTKSLLSSLSLHKIYTNTI